MTFAVDIAVPSICALRFHPVNYLKLKRILSLTGKEVIRLEAGAQETLPILFPWIPRTANIEGLATVFVAEDINIVPCVIP